MNGYDIELIRQKNDPLNVMLDNINPSSKVLEFGCANGRMTRYLSEEMNCSVDIIEYDKELFSMAIQYAHDGLCGDICDYTWVDYFQGTTYDYIIFADVLEHLSSPKTVLEKCYTFLNDTGLIWISVPNIAYNDIIIKLLNNQFDYSDTGLLDKTHIHFFTEKSAKKMFLDAGYYIAYEDGIYKQTFCSEQLLTEFLSWKPEYDYLQNRNLGELYQSIFALSKLANFSLGCPNFHYYLDAIKYYERRVYLDCGYGFEDAIISQELYENTDLKIDIPLPNDTCMVWVCPAFKKRFIIKNLSIYADEKPIDYCKINAERHGNDYYFTSLESFLYISDLVGCSMLKIRGTIIFINEFDYQYLNTQLQETIANYETKQQQLLKTVSEYQSNEQTLLKDNKKLAETIQNLSFANQKITDLNKQLEELIVQKENDSREQDALMAQRLHIIYSRIEGLLSVDAKPEDCSIDIQDILEKIDILEQNYLRLKDKADKDYLENQHLLLQLNEIKNSFSWKVTGPFRSLRQKLCGIKK